MQHTYPLFVGRSPRVGSGQARALAAHAMSPFKLRRYRKEFQEGIFNPAYLQGTGLAVDEHGQVLLIGGPEEDVFFDLEHLDRLEVIEDVYSRGIMRNHATDCRVHIHVYGFHAMTLHRFKHDTARQIVSALLSIRDVPLTYRQVFHTSDTSGGDGGGGGG